MIFFLMRKKRANKKKPLLFPSFAFSSSFLCLSPHFHFRLPDLSLSLPLSNESTEMNELALRPAGNLEPASKKVGSKRRHTPRRTRRSPESARCVEPGRPTSALSRERERDEPERRAGETSRRDEPERRAGERRAGERSPPACVDVTAVSHKFLSSRAGEGRGSVSSLGGLGRLQAERERERRGTKNSSGGARERNSNMKKKKHGLAPSTRVCCCEAATPVAAPIAHFPCCACSRDPPGRVEAVDRARSRSSKRRQRRRSIGVVDPSSPRFLSKAPLGRRCNLRRRAALAAASETDADPPP